MPGTTAALAAGPNGGIRITSEQFEHDAPQDSHGLAWPRFIGYQYRSAAAVSEAPVPADPDAVSLVDELRGQPGTRVPHVWVSDDGSE